MHTQIREICCSFSVFFCFVLTSATIALGEFKYACLLVNQLICLCSVFSNKANVPAYNSIRCDLISIQHAVCNLKSLVYWCISTMGSFCFVMSVYYTIVYCHRLCCLCLSFQAPFPYRTAFWLVSSNYSSLIIW